MEREWKAVSWWVVDMIQGLSLFVKLEVNDCCLYVLGQEWSVKSEIRSDSRRWRGLPSLPSHPTHLEVLICCSRPLVKDTHP